MTEFQMYLQWLAKTFHILFGIIWIGGTAYSGLMGRRKKAPEPPIPGVIGRTTVVHSGDVGIYEYRSDLPPGIQEIARFRWQSLATWLSGMILLVWLYWYGGMMYGGKLPPNQGIALGAATVFGGAFCYWLLWWRIRPGSRYEWLGWVVSYAGMVGLSYLLCKYLSGRAAYMHMGVMLGTIMALVNVWLVIVRNQNVMLKSLRAGGQIDQALVQDSGRRTLHNQCLTLPVIAIMVSNHYFNAYGHQYAWAILAGVILVSGALGALILRKAP